ncbi:MAG: hypothetical protein VYD19_05670, partial [Myxococcota bacterium]|nr:hypothetical protein [Myxococcota bacterium]
DTEGASVSVSEERGYSMGGNSSSERNFGSTTSESRSQSLSGGYALGSSRGSTVSDSSSLSNTRTWNLSQGESSSTVVSEGQSVAEALTLSDSSSSSSTQSYTGFIPQGRFGIFYRQTTRWVRRAEVRSYDLCGVAQHVGELQFNEYTWAPDLAIGDSCDELPPPAKLPAAACLIPPCN